MLASILSVALNLEQPMQMGSAASRDQIHAACSAAVGTRPKVEGIEVVPSGLAADGDLHSLKVSDAATGAWMTVYYDATSVNVAWARAACLGAQIKLLAEAIVDEREGARWFSVVFTADPAYIPPRDGSDTRWTVATTTDGRLPDASQEKLLVVIPHEQVHSYQRRAGAQTPRWFHEGHAEWLGRKVTAQIAPRAAQDYERQSAADLLALNAPAALRNWGGVRVKPEAIMRQVSEQDRKRMEADPTYSPSGPFSFGPEDMESDESNMKARYQAAWSIFHDLAQMHGDAAVQAWVAAATRNQTDLTSDQLAASIKATFGDDITSKLQP